MLINLSNHPSLNWSEKQMQTANMQFGEIVDLPFPQINPHDTIQQIMLLAQDYKERIIAQISSNQINAVHIMGELTFCFCIVNILKEAGFKCVASTTNRIVIEEANGKKTTQFEFAQFREYF